MPNTRCHSASLSGGIAPMIGFHSMMERPESVRRVIAPSMTCTSTMPASASSHSPTARSAVAGRAAAAPMGAVWT